MPTKGDRYHHGDLRSALIDAAIGVIADRGVRGFSVAEASRRLGVTTAAPYRHFADRDELLAAVCVAAMAELGTRMTTAVAAVGGEYGEPLAAMLRLHAIGSSYLEFAREEPGWFATAYAVPQQHAYIAPAADAGPDLTPLGQLRGALDELVDAGVLPRERREDVEYPVWSTVHGMAVLAGKGPLRAVPEETRRHLEELTLTFIGNSLS